MRYLRPKSMPTGMGDSIEFLWTGCNHCGQNVVLVLQRVSGEVKPNIPLCCSTVAHLRPQLEKELSQ